ncbi:hypothetical protein ACQEUU_37500 [Nonomuraea sp. CA-218870]|uniref:hypothetical protein n=1 Tax=Nonomuraea sp. CA-218870 TaxID=3239998 RepID=UPI003D8C0465
MAKAGYSVVTGAAVSLSASTAKTVLGVLAPSEFGLDLKKVWFGFTGVTANEAPVLCEVCVATFATNAPATNSTTLTTSVRQVYGRAIDHGVTAARNWTSEPTVLTPIAEFPLTPNGGTLLYDWPLGDTPDCAPSNGFALRFTAAASVSVRASMTWERC